MKFAGFMNDCYFRYKNITGYYRTVNMIEQDW